MPQSDTRNAVFRRFPKSEVSAKVVKRIDELKCHPTFYERPYVWEPYRRG